ncbi:MAG: amidase [Nitrososphaerota archaeon]
MQLIKKIKEAYLSGKEKPVSYTEKTIQRCKQANQEINAFINILDSRAKRYAELAERRVNEFMNPDSLAGIPIAIKDIFYIRGVRCTVGSKILSDFIPSYTSTVVQKLERAGAIIVGTTNLHEFASGVTTVNPFFGATKNPWDKQRIVGGSSGGSAAAVAAGLVPLALGTDTSGSIRIPAALCGVFGLKPTYGLVSKYGVFPLSKSLDHVGPIASDTAAIATALEYISGYDSRDPDSKRYKRREYIKATKSPLRVKNAIIPDSLLSIPIAEDVVKAFKLFISNLQKLGIKLEHKNCEYLKRTRDVWAPIRFGEALAYHYDWYRSRPNDYGKDVLNRLRAGEQYSAVDYIRALDEKEKLASKTNQDIPEDGVMITPSVAAIAPKIGQNRIDIAGKEYDVYQVLSSFTVPFNVTGLPAISIPAFLTGNGLPIGMQVVGKENRDDIVLNLASNYEKEFGINRKITAD